MTPLLAWSVAVLLVVAVALIMQLVTDVNPLGRCVVFWKQLRGQERHLTCSGSVEKGVQDYTQLHQQSASTRNAQYQALVNSYYDLATVFYEWGWGPCFHFCTQFSGERFTESLKRHEYYLASFVQQGLAQQRNLDRATNAPMTATTTTTTTVSTSRSPWKILDVGCGIGGPLRNIASFTGWDVTGITLNPYQVMRGNELTRRDVRPLVGRSVQGDFMHMPFASASFDGAYAIEATCHAPDRVQCFAEIKRVLKPGSVFACYEWCLTNKFQPNNPRHVQMKRDIEQGNGLPDIITTGECLQAMRDAGFEIILAEDLAATQLPGRGGHAWYYPITPNANPLTLGFQLSPLGKTVVNSIIYVLDALRLAPRGTYTTQCVLQKGGLALSAAGQEGIFTAMYLMVGRVPTN